MKTAYAILALWAGSLAAAGASELLLTIEAHNPAKTEQAGAIRSPLPIGTRPDNVIDAGGLDIEYDACRNLYLATGRFDMEAHETREFVVRLLDMWRIPQATCGEIEGHARELEKLLRTTGHRAADARSQTARIVADISRIRESQSANALQGTNAAAHIEAYWRDCHRLDDLRDAVRELEDALIRSGIDPPRILGELPPGSGEGTRAYPTPGGGLVLRLRLTNPSPNLPRKTELMQALPHEVTAEDVLDTDGLRLHRDARSEALSVKADSVDLGPGENIVFAVRVRDVWSAEAPRCGHLLADADSVRALVPWRYESVHRHVDRVVAELRRIDGETVPPPDDPGYVAFQRRRAKCLDRLERKLLRFDRLRFPDNPIGTVTPPPTRRTTWAMIYATLVFLATFSSAVFLKHIRD